MHKGSSLSLSEVHWSLSQMSSVCLEGVVPLEESEVLGRELSVAEGTPK